MQLFFFFKRKLCSDAGYLTDVRKTASKENYRRSLTKFLCRSFVILNYEIPRKRKYASGECRGR